MKKILLTFFFCINLSILFAEETREDRQINYAKKVLSGVDSITNISPIYKSSMSYHSFDYMVLYRHNKDGRYMEIGPSLQTIRKVNLSDEFPSANTFDLEDVNQLQTNLIFGFGAYFIGTENFGITTGFRISYTLSDLISNKGQEEFFPTQKN